MKVAVLLACTCAVLTTKRVVCASVKAPLDIISLEDISESDRKLLDFLDSTSRSKRSGEDALHSLKASIGQGIKSKLGLIAKGSASGLSHLSSSSSGGHSYHHHYPETYDHKSFDLWSLKKSILNTLLQAVKAIKGGVIAIKGQLIKGSGYLISAKGKLISAKGQAISDLGKKIATSAVLSPSHHHGHSAGGHADYSHYHHSSAGGYGSPSAPGPEYEVPEHFHHHSSPHEDKPDSDHAGILILKKIPSHGDHGHSDHLPAEHKVPDFKAIKPSGPSLGTIIGKFFSASTSLKPGEPAPFGDTSPGHDSYHDSHHDHSSHSSHDSHHDHSSHSSHEDYHSSSHEHHHDVSHEYLPASSHSDASGHSKPSSSSYEGPFEEAPSFLNIHEYASESKTSASQTTKPKSPPESVKQPEELKVQSTPITFDEIRPLPTGFSNSGFDTSQFLNSYTKPTAFVGTLSDKPNVNFPPYQNLKYLSAIKPTSLDIDSTFNFGGFQSVGGISNVKYLAPPMTGPQVFPDAVTSSSANYPVHSPIFSHYNGFLSTVPSSAQKVPHKRPTRSKVMHKHKRPPTYSMVRSVAYKLGPNGPKRL